MTLIKGGFVLVDAQTGAVARILPFQYNPAELVYTVTDAATRISLVGEYDATGGLAASDAATLANGVGPQLAALRGLVADTRDVVVLFAWGSARIAPVTIAELTITETAFDERLHPIAATVSITLQVLSGRPEPVIGQPPPQSVAARLADAYAQVQERLAGSAPTGTLAELGIERP
jgi:hypothetical protein